MAVATISVNFASLADIQAGTSAVQSISPYNLKNALTSGNSLYNLNVGSATFNSGVTIASGNLSVAGNITVSSAGSSFNGITSSAGLTVTAGVTTIQAGLTVSAGILNIQSTTPSSSYTTGALVVAGGMGVAGDIFTGPNGDLIVGAGGIIQSVDDGRLRNMASFAAPRINSGTGIPLFRATHNMQLTTAISGLGSGASAIILNIATTAGTTIAAGTLVTMTVTTAPTNVCISFGYKYT
jgi:hypothetical protein